MPRAVRKQGSKNVFSQMASEGHQGPLAAPDKTQAPTRLCTGGNWAALYGRCGQTCVPLLVGCVSLERHVPLEKFPAVSNVLIHHSPASEAEPSKQDVHSVCDCMSVSEHFSPSHSLLMASTCVASSASVCLGQKHINTMETMCKKASSFFSFLAGWAVDRTG